MKKLKQLRNDRDVPLRPKFELLFLTDELYDQGLLRELPELARPCSAKEDFQ